MKEKLKWFYDKNYGIEPFTILGEKNIDIQNEIEAKEKDIEEINKKITEKIKNISQSFKNRNIMLEKTKSTPKFINTSFNLNLSA